MRTVTEVDLGEFFQPSGEYHFSDMRSFSPLGSPPLSPLTMSRHLSPIHSPSTFYPPLPLLHRSYISLLPWDIWRYLFDYFNNEELFNLASVSHSFKDNCLGEICNRMRFGRGDEFIFADGRDPGSILLLRSLLRLGWEIPKLTFTFRYSISDLRFPGEISFIRRVLTHIQHHATPAQYPNEVALDFCHTGSSMLFPGPSRKRIERRSVKPLQDLFDYIILLTGALTVRCGRAKRPIRKSDINHAAKQLGFGEEAEPPVPPVDVLGQIKSSITHCFPQFFGFASAYCANDNVEMQELPFYATNDFRRRTNPMRAALPSSGLRRLNIHSPILFHPSILRWTLILFWSRCRDLTHLSLHTPDVPRSCWDALLSHLRAPQIQSINLDDCTFSLAEISSFIAQQTQLRTLVLGHSLSDSSHGVGNEHHPPWIPLQDVTSITATPSCFTRLLFGPTLVAPRLEFATFALRTVKDETIADMDKALSFIYNRLYPINLTLQLTMTTGSARWFHSQIQYAPTLGTQRPPIRHLMTSLRIYADIYKLEGEFWNHLPSWISTFLPNVLSVFIVERQLSSHHECGVGYMGLDIRGSPEVRQFIKNMKQHCRNVVFLQVGDVKYPTEA